MDSSKKLSIEAEGKVKQLKDEAVAARKELDDLKRRERTIEKERDTILAQKEKAAEQSAILQKSISQFEVDAAKEIEALELEVQQVEQKIQDTKQVDVAKVAEESLKKQAEQREEYMKQHETVKAQMEANTKEFVAHIRDALQDLMNEVASAPEEEDLGAQVTNCKDDVNSLVSRIQVNATISS
jgi:predicted  nucleic acid-binding Zn-ribbon protein